MEFCRFARVGLALDPTRLIGARVQHVAPTEVRRNRALAIVDEGSNEIRVEHRSASSPVVR
jgi:hypothetical protein